MGAPDLPIPTIAKFCNRRDGFAIEEISIVNGGHDKARLSQSSSESIGPSPIEFKTLHSQPRDF
jgi:hypothetical protein